MSTQAFAEVGALRLAALTAGSSERPAIVLLHGWPLCSAIWAPVMPQLSKERFVLAFDLPGTGKSTGGTPIPTLKADIAEAILDGANALGARDLIVAGVDVGGMIAFAAARDFGNRVAGAVIMNTVLPGLDPWNELLAHPQIWHFALHQITNLPEILVTGRERAYFDFFLDMLAADKTKLDDQLRRACVEQYATPSALRTGFDWYRSMPQDAEHNAVTQPIDTPILYLRGDADRRPIDPYLDGLRKAGASRVQGKTIPGSGELLSVEAPDLLVAALLQFADGLSARQT
ncbi:alpha/beta hydrolase [Pleomorphomonas diazotrophica]|uniref:Alpha/beta hydrolase n=1 Tax=Pleomorphomonas diazotrophica TaxID=1166257 RepID=A0A1I4QGE8_9HYPH|nr:alpha/beta hydrolase [Pleomorphomonas diazotrophica]PKR90676.1 alpha/beta hydrolase [Pleomorphomonas diazotrophica]SFM39171.1 Pimeloyl-ACP methyl ester carboxylesterase [Pleomorphomonas diazotrophica]